MTLDQTEQPPLMGGDRLDRVKRKELILKILKEIVPVRIGIAYNQLKKVYGEDCCSYKTFQRMISQYAEEGLINTKLVYSGGRSTEIFTVND